MENETYIYEDSSHEIHKAILKPTSFNLHQKDKEIHDVAIKGKPTTFFKDALRRFVRNKSSVAASIILGILVLFALIIPFALPYDTTGKTTTGTNYLPPKLFEAGTGFWDGTKKYDNMIYNPETKLPDGNFDASAIVGEVKTYGGKVDNTPNQFASGGYIRIGSTGGNDYVWADKTINIDPSKTFLLSYTMDQGISGYDAVPYFIRLSYSITNANGEAETKNINLVDNSSQFGTVTDLDVTKAIADSGVTSSDTVALQVGINGTGEEKLEGVFLKSLSLKQDGTEIPEFSFSDANAALLKSTWKLSSNGQSGLSQADITYCSFTYNPYLIAYGEYEDTYSSNDMQALIDKGYVSYDFSTGVSSFKILDDRSPVRKVLSQDNKSAAGITVVELKVIISKYRQKGFATMPFHIFGTDSNGIDMFKYVAEGLRNSLLIAIGVSIICIAFGLVFGAIEGYFGGYVDLFMERFVDILANIPSIILITICVLHLGQGFGVFMLAMCMTGWLGTSAITRTQFYRFKRREYILAARSLGAKDGRLIFRHILPNAVGTIITSSVLIIPSVIFAEASIAYLGIGLQGLSSLGVILSDNQVNIGSNQYLLIFPSVILALLLICFNLMGNGLRDAFNPSTKGSD